MTLGIDIGGTTISLGLVEGSEIVKKTCVSSFAKDATLQETMDYLSAQIAAIIVPGVTKIGIGVPSVADPVKGIVYNAMNIPSWKEVHMKEELEKRFGIPVAVNNDANCYALGAATRVKGAMVVTVTLGTGTGVGIVAEGRLLSGTHCGAGEIASLPYEGKDYESFCSKKFFTDRGILNVKEAAEEADQGEPAMLSLFCDFGARLGEFLAVVMFAYDADCIILGGGISHCFRHFRESMWKSLRALYPYQRSLDELTIQVLSDADYALLGAASL
jgi:glucokinase